MNIETVWYTLVGVYIFWITLVATLTTVFAVRVARTLLRLTTSPQRRNRK